MITENKQNITQFPKLLTDMSNSI